MTMAIIAKELAAKEERWMKKFQTHRLATGLVVLVLVMLFLSHLKKDPIDYALSYRSCFGVSITKTTQEIGKESSTSDISGNKREFLGYGSGAYLFVKLGAYRAESNTLSVVGLGSKPVHVYSNAYFTCEWIDNNGKSISGSAYKFMPDWGFGRVYTVLVINCTFPEPVGVGKLILTAFPGNLRILALEETENSYNSFLQISTASPKYDIMYCGSPLFGDLSPQRIREWIAYHVMLFGKKSHFVLYDAGGIHAEVRKVLRPWIDGGYVTIQDIRDQERFDTYYHNQFLVVNDCLHRYRLSAKWMFFFDVDEYLYLPNGSSLKALLGDLERQNYTQFTIEQHIMSVLLCLRNDFNHREWGLEKMVWKDGIRREHKWERKYAVQPRYAQATGVHLSEDIFGRILNNTDGNKIKYYHYHSSINIHKPEICKHQIDAKGSNLTVDFYGRELVRDDSMKNMVSSIKQFELKSIGSVLLSTSP